MKVSGVFYSISGEGIHVGIPTVFIRLAGCDLDCTWCDTRYAQKPEQGEEVDVTDVMKRVRGFKNDGWVLITGGNPLCQMGAVRDLVNALKAGRYLVEVEENGSIDPPEWSMLVDSWSVDVKCPSSGPSYGTFRRRWLTRLRKQDQLKFVVGTQEDLNFVRGFLNGARLRPTILISPIVDWEVYHDIDPALRGLQLEWLQEVAEFCKELSVRMSLQLHRIIWENKEGV